MLADNRFLARANFAAAILQDLVMITLPQRYEEK